MANPVFQIIHREHLPEVRGRYSPDAPLGCVGWFRTGGTAEILFKPVDIEDLSLFLTTNRYQYPVTILGVLSNSIIRDGGVSGVVIRFKENSQRLNQWKIIVFMSAHRHWMNVAEAAAMNGIAGLEFLCGVPGSIGGALALNAGAYGSEIKDILVRADLSMAQDKSRP